MLSIPQQVEVTLVAFEDQPERLKPFAMRLADDGSGDLASLEIIFRILNHVCPGDGERMPTGGKHRSLSCGDIVTFSAVDGRRSYLCASMGWKAMTQSECDSYLTAPESSRRAIIRAA